MKAKKVLHNIIGKQNLYFFKKFNEGRYDLAFAYSKVRATNQTIYVRS